MNEIADIPEEIQRLIDLACSIHDIEDDTLEIDGKQLFFFDLCDLIGDDLDIAKVVFEHYRSPERSERERLLAAWVAAPRNDNKERAENEVRFRTDALLSMMRPDETGDVMHAIASGLGKLDDPRAVPVMWSLRDHPNFWVRWSLTFGAAHHAADPMAVQLLLHLLGDDDDRVRDWAAHHFGNEVDDDSVEIREALASLLGDGDAWNRLEAMNALSQRGDERVLEPLVRELEVVVPLLERMTTDEQVMADPDEYPDLHTVQEVAWKVASQTGDERLAPLLRLSWRDALEDDDGIPADLADAVKAVFGQDAPPDPVTQ